MAKLLIGCYSYDSSAKYGTRYIDVVTDIRQKVEALDQQRTAHALQLQTGNGFEAIFVAPEYLFTKENNTKKREPLSAGHKQDIIRDLKGISKAFPRVLMFPGTIFWEEPLATDIALKKMMANVVAAELNTKKIAQTQQFFDEAVKDGWQTGGKVKVPSLAQVTKQADKNTFRAYNSLYGFLNEAPVIKPYSKQWDFKETEGANPSVRLYVPGSSSATDEIDGFQFGFEICFDHTNGALKAKGNEVEFHILVSDSVGTQTGEASLANGGYLIHASSKPANTGVWRRTGGNVQTVGPPNAGALASNQMAYWLVDVAAKPVLAQGLAANVNAMAATIGPTTPSGKTLPPGAFKLPGLK